MNTRNKSITLKLNHMKRGKIISLTSYHESGHQKIEHRAYLRQQSSNNKTKEAKGMSDWEKIEHKKWARGIH